MKAREKDDLSTPRQVLESQKLKIPALKNLPDVKRHPKTLELHFTKREKTLIKNLNQWICKGIERERKGELVFPTGKNQRSPSAVAANVCEISRFSVNKVLSNASKEQKTCKSRKLVVDENLTVLIRRY